MTTEEIRSATVPEVPGVLTSADVLATAQAIATVQRHDGQIPWFEGGHCDPWNHVEAAMALTVCGLVEEAVDAYRWLARRQLPDGSWFNYYQADAVKDPRLDTNVCGYLAAGAWHHHLITGDVEFLGELWPTIEQGIDFILRFQQPDGSVLWSRDSAGRLERYALLTGSSSIYHSMRCAVAIAECLAKDRPDWELAAGRLGHAVAHHPGAFAPKVEFAMDWYYPMLSGALEGEAGRRRIAEGWSTFVMEGLGVRCVSTGDWVTAAETAECVLTLDALGMDEPGTGAVHVGPEPAAGGRLLLDGHGVPGAGDLPQGRADDLHLRRHGAGGRRAVEHHPGGRPVPGRRPAGRTRPGRAALRRRHRGLHRGRSRRGGSPAADRTVRAAPGRGERPPGIGSDGLARVDSPADSDASPRATTCSQLSDPLTAGEDPLVTRRRRLTLVAMCIAQGMTLLDVTIVNTALPSIQRELHMTAGRLEWVISAYALSLAAFIPLGGALGDRFGRKRFFLVGMVVFTLGSVACALSTSDVAFIGSRALQGAGGASCRL